MTTKRKSTKRSPAPELLAELRGRYLLTVYGWNGPGSGKQVRGFDTRAELLEYLADAVTGGKGSRVGEEEVYVLTILDRRARK